MLEAEEVLVEAAAEDLLEEEAAAVALVTEVAIVEDLEVAEEAVDSIVLVEVEEEEGEEDGRLLNININILKYFAIYAVINIVTKKIKYFI